MSATYQTFTANFTASANFSVRSLSPFWDWTPPARAIRRSLIMCSSLVTPFLFPIMDLKCRAWPRARTRAIRVARHGVSAEPPVSHPTAVPSAVAATRSKATSRLYSESGFVRPIGFRRLHFSTHTFCLSTRRSRHKAIPAERISRFWSMARLSGHSIRRPHISPSPPIHSLVPPLIPLRLGFGRWRQRPHGLHRRRATDDIHGTRHGRRQL